MNRLFANDRCWVCGFNLREAFRRATTTAGSDRSSIRLQLESLTVSARQSIERQIFNGMCDTCQRLRHAAAVEYAHAADEMRLISYLGAGYDIHGLAHPVLASAMRRLQTADALCVELKMWPYERTTKRPTRFYREDPE